MQVPDNDDGGGDSGLLGTGSAAVDWSIVAALAVATFAALAALAARLGRIKSVAPMELDVKMKQLILAERPCEKAVLPCVVDERAHKAQPNGNIHSSFSSFEGINIHIP